MIMPLYFPFTTLSRTTMTRLSACFERIAVYQVWDNPTQDEPAMQMGDLLKRVRPVTGDEKKIAAVIRDYKNWIQLHEASPSAFLKTLSSRVPITADASVSKIRSDLRERIAGKVRPEFAEPSVDPLFVSRLFLAVAQEHDFYTFSLLEDMLAQKRMERALYDRLKGEPGDLHRLFRLPSAQVGEDPGAAMIRERIRAWSVLLLHDPALPGVCLTDSPAVMAFLKDHGPEPETAFCIESVPIRQPADPAMLQFKKQLAVYLHGLATGMPPGKKDHVPEAPSIKPEESTVSLTIAAIPGVNARKYFSGFVSPQVDGKNAETETKYCSTVICHVAPVPLI